MFFYHTPNFSLKTCLDQTFLTSLYQLTPQIYLVTSAGHGPLVKDQSFYQSWSKKGVKYENINLFFEKSFQNKR